MSDAEVYMSGDASPQPAPTGSPTRADAAGPGEPAPARAVVLPVGLQGNVDVTASLFLRDDAGGLIPLTAGSPLTVVLDLAGVQEPLVAEAAVPSGTYDGLLVRFTDVTAQVTGGLEIDGLPFVGTVEVDLGGSALDVTSSLDLDMEDGDTVSLLVDLDADRWIPLLDVVDVLTGIVASADFSGAVTVVER